MHATSGSIGINIAENITLLFLNCLKCNLVMHVIVCTKKLKKFAKYVMT